MHSEQLDIEPMVFDLKTMGKKFIFCPTNEMILKAQEIEKTGIELYEQIKKYPNLFSILIDDANSFALRSRADGQDIDERIIENNRNVMEWVQINCAQALSLEGIKKIHQMLTNDIYKDDETNVSGNFRNTAVYIGLGYTILDEGIDFRKLEPALNEIFDLFNNNQFLNKTWALFNSLIFEFLIVYIHPFSDSNGKTGLALFYWHVLKNNLKFLKIFGIERYRRHYRKKYYELSHDARFTCDVTHLIDFNLDALKDALTTVSKKMNFLLKMQIFKNDQKFFKDEKKLLQKCIFQKFKQFEIEENWSIPNLKNDERTYEIQILKL